MSSVDPAIEIFCGINVFSISEFVAGLAEASSVDSVVVVFRFVLVLLKEEFDVILGHYCILNVRCVLGSDPFDINDEHGPTPRVRDDELVVIGGDDSVVGPFVSAGRVHVDIHLGFRWKGFFAVFIVLVSPESFQVG